MCGKAERTDIAKPHADVIGAVVPRQEQTAEAGEGGMTSGDP